MADNILVTSGTGNTIAADDVGGVLHQRVKISQGADGSATDVSSAAPLQVTLANGTVPSHAVTNAGTFAVQATLQAGSALAGKFGIDQTTPGTTNATTQIPSAAGTGLSVSKTDALVATAVAVKASAGNLYGYHIYNSNTADMFVHFYNIASGSVSVGSSTRTISLCVPGGGVIDGLFSTPVAFSTAIAIAATTTITGSSAPGTGLLTDIFYI